MTKAEREEQILGIKSASFQSEVNEQLEARLRQRVIVRCVSLVHCRLVTTDDDSSDEFTAARNTWHPIVATVTGIGRLAAVLWLMMFKPF